MNIQQLPEEILIIVFKKLNSKSLFSVYNTCMCFRKIVTTGRVVKELHFSLSYLATAESLKESFFLDTLEHLETLDLCAVPDLRKVPLMKVARRLKKLKALNVAYTYILIPDLIEFCKLCPTLKDVKINFTFGKFTNTVTLSACQEMFKHFENIEFVGTVDNLLYSQLPLHILSKATLKTAKFTVIQNSDHPTYKSKDCSSVFTFEQLHVLLSHWKKDTFYYGNLEDIVLFSSLDSRQFEFVIMKRMNFDLCKIYTSQVFEGIFKKYFYVEEECITDFTQQQLSGNVNIMLWNKQTTCFDDTFFLKFINYIKEQFPCHYNSSYDKERLPQVESSWYHITVAPTEDPSKDSNKNQEPALKKTRVAPKSHILCFDCICKNTEKIQLNLDFDVILKNPVTLPPNSQYLKKITYLSLSGPNVQYSMDFFKILFEKCDKLHTLNIEASPLSPCVMLISKSILYTKSLRNLRLVDTRINFKLLWSSICLYGLIENIHVVDKSSEFNELGDVNNLIAKCSSMYSLFIQMNMSVKSRSKAISKLKKAKQEQNRPYLNIELYSSYGYMGLSYDPYIDVFKLNPIKRI